MNYVEHHFGDYAKDTRHLTLIEHGAYRMLMDIYYINERPLPADCHKLINAKTAGERRAVTNVLSQFFEFCDNAYRHKRCDSEIERFQDKQKKAKRSANLRWNFPKEQASERNANAMPPHSEGNAPNHQSPVTSNQTPNTREKKKTTSPTAPPDVDPKVWADWTQLRKNKRAPVTNTALDGLRREAQKAGLTLEAALRLACERGWMGFKAEWLEDRRTINGSHSKQSALEQRNAEAGAEWLRRHKPPEREPEIFDAIATERST